MVLAPSRPNTSTPKRAEPTRGDYPDGHPQPAQRLQGVAQEPRTGASMSGGSVVDRVRDTLAASPAASGFLPVIEVGLSGAALRLSGELPSVEAKRRVVAAVQTCVEEYEAVSDALTVRPLVEMSTKEMRALVFKDLVQDTLLRRCDIAMAEDGQVLRSRSSKACNGQVRMNVDQGVVRLEGRVPTHVHFRVAEVLAWRCPGTCNVANSLSVLPEQSDGDPQIEIALRYVLDGEPLLHSSVVSGFVRSRVALLKGSAPDATTREIAEYCTWMVPGVAEVQNHLALA